MLHDRSPTVSHKPFEKILIVFWLSPFAAWNAELGSRKRQKASPNPRRLQLHRVFHKAVGAG